MAVQLMEFITVKLAPFYLEISLGLLFLLWIIFFIRYPVILLNPVIKELQSFYDFLSTLDNSNINNRPKLKEYIKNTKEKSFLRTIWADFEENCSSQPDWNEYFNVFSLVDIPTRRNQITSIPTFLITIGLTASFSCFILRFVTANPNTSLSQILYPTVVEMGIVALVSFLLSYLFDRIMQSTFHKAEERVYEINRMLLRKLPISQKDTQIERITSALDNMSNSLSNYAQYSAHIQQNGMNQLVDTFLEGLHSKMENQLQELGEVFRSFSFAQKQALHETEAYLGELSKGAEVQSQVNKASSSIISSIAQYHEQISSSSQNLSNSLKELQSLSHNLNDIVTHNVGMLDNIESERRNLKEEYRKTIQDIYESIQMYQKNTSNELEQALEQFSDVSEKIFIRLEGSVFNSIDSWTNSHKSAMQELEEHSKDMNNVSKEFSLNLGKLNTSLNLTMKEFTQAIEKGTRGTISEFDEGLAEITQRLSNTLTEIRDTIEDLPVIIDSLGKRLD